jgi:hypothetical protein
MALKGSLVVHPPLEDAADPDVVGAMPGGSHPPLEQVPPPSAANGSGVVQLALEPDEVPGDELDDDGAPLDGGDIPGGSQPPL